MWTSLVEKPGVLSVPAPVWPEEAVEYAQPATNPIFPTGIWIGFDGEAEGVTVPQSGEALRQTM